MDRGLDDAARESDIRKLDEIYIVNNADSLEKWQRDELQGFIAQWHNNCLRQNADGIRINLSLLSPYIIKRIKLYIANQIEYNQFFL